MELRSSLQRNRLLNIISPIFSVVMLILSLLFFQMSKSASASADFAPTHQANAVCAQNVTVDGEFLQWFPLTITFEGPFANENDVANPFLDYRLDVTFVSANGTTQVVPGYFAADGNAANTGATSGNKWRVHFVPSEPGIWTYTASFLSGKDIAIQMDTSSGVPTSFNGTTGTLNINVASPAQTRGFVGKGMLEYVGEHYFKFAGSGDYYLKNGADSPENILGFLDFDQTYYAGTRTDNTHLFAPHVQDWNPGDPVWKGDKGKGLIGGINYLASQDINSMYFLTYNLDGGDGEDVWMWTDPSVRDRYDVSKLAQWEIVFTHMSESGMQLHVVTQELENDEILDTYGDENFSVRRLYYRELVSRFAHHPALIWNIGEENDNTDEQRLGFAEHMRFLDPYDHPITIHTDFNVASTWYDGLLGSDYYEATSIQGSARNYHGWAVELRQRSAAAGRPWAIYGDEQGPAVQADMSNVTELVRDGAWGNLMGGGAGVEWYFGSNKPADFGDLQTDDWRVAEPLWQESGHAIDFFYQYLPFWEMVPNNNLLNGVSDANVLAKTGQIYAVHFPSGTSRYNPRLVLPDANSYSVRWYDPRNGGALQTGSVAQISGVGEQPIGQAPNNANQHWVALIELNAPEPPLTPANLTVTPQSRTSLQLTWEDSDNKESGFEIWRQTATGLQRIATVPSNTTSYVDTDLMMGTNYCYQIRAFNSGFNSDFTDPACATTNPNQAPIIDPVDEINMVEEEVLDVLITATDPDGDVMTGSLISGPDFASFPIPATIRLEPQAGDAGDDYTVTVQAEDAFGGITQLSFTVKVAPKPSGSPSVDAIVDQNDTVGDAISLPVTASDPDNDTLTYTAQSLPDGLSINNQTGQITGTIAAGADVDSPYTVIVEVEDPSQNTAQSVFTWTIAPLILPPAAPTNLIATATSDTTIQLTWQDNADDELNFEVWRQTPTGFELLSTLPVDTVTFEDSNLQPETEYCYQVRATTTDLQSDFTVIVCATTPATPVNQPPVIQAIADINMTEGDVQDVTLTVTDPDSDNVTVTMPSAPAFAQLQTQSNVQLAPQVGDAGDNYTVNIQADDGDGGVTQLSFIVNVAPLPINEPAVLALNLVVAETNEVIRPIAADDTIVLSQIAATELSIEAITNDIDVKSVAFTLNDSLFRIENSFPYVIAGDRKDGSYKPWDYAIDQEYVLTATPYTEGGANGEAGIARTVTFIIVEESLEPPNFPPNITAIADQDSTVGNVISLQVVASDSENDTITYGAQSLPAGLSINAQSGLISGTIADGAEAQSPYTVTVTAGDGINPLSQIAFNWTVEPVPVPPAAPSNLVATATSQTTIELTWQDNADNETSFEVRRQTQNGMALLTTLPADSTSYTDTGLQDNTTYCYQVRAINADFSSADTTLTCDTTPNLPPTVNAIADQNSTTGTAINLQVAATDPENDTLTFGAQSLPTGLSVNAQTGLISGTIANGAEAQSPYTVTATADDSINPPVEVSFTWIVIPAPVPPVAPSNLVAIAPSATTIQLTWDDNSGDETAFEVRRQIQNGMVLLGSVPANTTSYFDNNLQPETEYCYQVRAVRDDLSSTDAALTCATTPPAPNIPPVIQAVADVNMTETQVVDVALQVSDANGDNVTITLPTAPAFAQPIGNNIVRLSPQNGDEGTAPIVVRGDDGNGGITEITFDVNVAPFVDNTPTVLSFSLYNAQTDTFVRTLGVNDTIVLSDLGTDDISILAETNNVSIGSILFDVNGDSDFKLENSAPYTLGGDGGGNIRPWDYILDQPYTITATPYTESGGNGTAGNAATINITVVQDLPAVAAALEFETIPPVLEAASVEESTPEPSAPTVEEPAPLAPAIEQPVIESANE